MIRIRQARAVDAPVVASILAEAAAWLDARGISMWKGDELSPARVAIDVETGLFFLAEVDGVPAGTIKFQLADPEFWPDQPLGDSAYIHRLAVRRQFAGGVVSTALLQWAAQRTASLGLRCLRLDTEASRPALRAVYERFGFRHHSDRHVGPYFVARYELEPAKPSV